jgi:hypothetical protein
MATTETTETAKLKSNGKASSAGGGSPTDAIIEALKASVMVSTLGKDYDVWRAAQATLIARHGAQKYSIDGVTLSMKIAEGSLASQSKLNLAIAELRSHIKQLRSIIQEIPPAVSTNGFGLKDLIQKDLEEIALLENLLARENQRYSNAMTAWNKSAQDIAKGYQIRFTGLYQDPQCDRDILEASSAAASADRDAAGDAYGNADEDDLTPPLRSLN